MKRVVALALALLFCLTTAGCQALIREGYIVEIPEGAAKAPDFAGFENFIPPVDEAHLKEENGITYQENTLLVLAAPGATQAELAAALAAHNLTAVGFVELAGAYQAETIGGGSLSYAELEALCRQLEKEEAVRMAIVSTVTQQDVERTYPDDDWDGASWDESAPGGTNWGMEAIGAPWVWENYDPPQTRVGVLDTMFDPAHEDVAYGALLDNDIFDAYVPEDRGDSARAHGTHVAATVGAIHNNGRGVSGAMENAELICLSMCGYESGAGAVSALAELVSYGARTINFSMGYPEYLTFSAAMGDPYALSVYENNASFCTLAMENMLLAGGDFLLVASAGNDAIEAKFGSIFTYITNPEVRGHIIVVGAAEQTASGYRLADFSNYGSRLDIVAPGVEIYSAVPGNRYESWQGTSMAAPHVTGVCAAIWALHPELTGPEIKDLVVNTADIAVSGAEAKMINYRGAVSSFREEKRAVSASMLPPGAYTFVNAATGRALAEEPGACTLYSGESIGIRAHYVYAGETDRLLQTEDDSARVGTAVRMDYDLDTQSDAWTVRNNGDGTCAFLLYGDPSLCLADVGGRTALAEYDAASAAQKWQYAAQSTNATYVEFVGRRGNIVLQLLPEALSGIAADRVQEWANNLETAADSYAELTGRDPNIPFIVNGCCQSETYAFRLSGFSRIFSIDRDTMQQTLANLAQRSNDWGFEALYTISGYTTHYSAWNFDPEILGCLNIAYVLERNGGAAAPVALGNGVYYEGGAIREAFYAMSDLEGGGDEMVGAALLGVQEMLGSWAPFKATYRYMDAHAAEYQGLSKRAVLDAFLKELSRQSGRDVMACYDESVWAQIFAYMETAPADGNG